MDNFKNFSKVTVSTGYNASDTSIVLSSGHGAKLPTAPFNVVWWNATDYADPSDDPNVEIVRVTAISTDTLTVTRAQESTTGSTKNTSGKTYLMIAAMTSKTFNTDIPGLASSSVTTRFCTVYETAGRFSTNNGGGGTLSYTTNGCVLSTVSSGSYAQNYLAGYGNSDYFAGSPSFSTQIALATVGTDFEFYTGIGGVQPQFGATIQREHISFKIVRTGSGTINLMGSNSDGTTESVTASLTTLAVNDVLDLYLKVNGTSSVDYYWKKNGGTWSTATNLATNIPTTYFDYSNISNTVTNVNHSSQTQITVFTSTYER